MHGKVANCHVLSGVVRQIKVPRYRLRCICHYVSTSRRCSRKRSPNLLPVSPMHIVLHKVHFYAIDNIGGGACEAVGDFNRSLGSRYFCLCCE